MRVTIHVYLLLICRIPGTWLPCHLQTFTDLSLEQRKLLCYDTIFFLLSLAPQPRLGLGLNHRKISFVADTVLGLYHWGGGQTLNFHPLPYIRPSL